MSGSRYLDVERLDCMDCAGLFQRVKTVTELLYKFLEAVHIQGEPTELISYDEGAASLAGQTETDGRCTMRVLPVFGCFDDVKDVLEDFGRKTFKSG